MFTQEFVHDARTRIILTRDLEGWELREERDHTVVKLTHYTDWHRVERALRALGFLLVPEQVSA
jgi:hypothetical protein